jgi:GTPase
MAELHVTQKKSETAVLIGVINQRQEESQVMEYLDELAFLAETAGIIPVKSFTQRLERPDKRTFLGSGKLAQVKAYVKENETSLVIFDDELSPSQIRNVEKELEVKVMDRTDLILDIFASRARTAHAKTQVELARYQYILPRLGGMWTHLERQRGGTGSMGGAGEKEIETDRRIVRNKISSLKDKLKEIDKQMSTQRKSRGEMVRVALVGYTNVGKSTIMNIISKSDVFAENKLFATLDTTVRKVVLKNVPLLLTDTVGFIRKLPTQLVESFKSTLDEVREADILVHVVDISHPNFEDHINVVTQTLRDIEAINKTTILVFNKIDAYQWIQKDEDDLSPDTPENISLDELKRSWMSRINDPVVFISAQQKENLEEFKDLLYRKVRELHLLRYPHNKLFSEEDFE